MHQKASPIHSPRSLPVDRPGHHLAFQGPAKRLPKGRARRIRRVLQACPVKPCGPRHERTECPACRISVHFCAVTHGVPSPRTHQRVAGAPARTPHEHCRSQPLHRSPAPDRQLCSSGHHAASRQVASLSPGASQRAVRARDHRTQGRPSRPIPSPAADSPLTIRRAASRPRLRTTIPFGWAVGPPRPTRSPSHRIHRPASCRAVPTTPGGSWLRIGADVTLTAAAACSVTPPRRLSAPASPRHLRRPRGGPTLPSTVAAPYHRCIETPSPRLDATRADVSRATWPSAASPGGAVATIRYGCGSHRGSALGDWFGHVGSRVLRIDSTTASTNADRFRTPTPGHPYARSTRVRHPLITSATRAPHPPEAERRAARLDVDY
jgi:hypothetical protein